MHEVTRILNENDSGAAERLLPYVYDELRRLASRRLSRESPNQTLSPTGLVHEAWLRLVRAEGDWESRGHFYSAAAEAMRRILIDNARRKRAAKHGGEFGKIEFELELIEDKRESDGRLLELDDAISKLAEVAPMKAELIKLRYFAGCSIRDAAKMLGISTATADRYWAFSRAWLQREMSLRDD